MYHSFFLAAYLLLTVSISAARPNFVFIYADDLGFGDADKTLQTAQDAIIGYEGLTITRGSNEISDVIAGATISLSNTTASSVRLTITSDTSILKTNIQNVVTV